MTTTKNDFLTPEWFAANGWKERHEGCGFGTFNYQLSSQVWLCWYNNGGVSLLDRHACRMINLTNYTGDRSVLVHTAEDLLFIVEALRSKLERGEPIP